MESDAIEPDSLSGRPAQGPESRSHLLSAHPLGVKASLMLADSEVGFVLRACFKV